MILKKIVIICICLMMIMMFSSCAIIEFFFPKKINYTEKILLKDESANYGFLCMKDGDTIYYVLDGSDGYGIYKYEKEDISLATNITYISGLTVENNNLYIIYYDNKKHAHTFAGVMFDAKKNKEYYIGSATSVSNSLSFFNGDYLLRGSQQHLVCAFPFSEEKEDLNPYEQVLIKNNIEIELSYIQFADSFFFSDIREEHDGGYYQNAAVFKDGNLPYLSSINENNPLVFLYQNDGYYYVQKNTKVYKFTLNGEFEEICDISEYGNFVTGFEIVNNEIFLFVRDTEINTFDDINGQYNIGINGSGGIWTKLIDGKLEKIFELPEVEEIVGKYQKRFATYDFSGKIAIYEKDGDEINKESELYLGELTHRLLFDQAGEFIFIYEYEKNNGEKNVLKYVINIETQEDVTEDFTNGK